jgi:hypothetical protein
MIKRRSYWGFFLIFVIFTIILTACDEKFGQTVITKPDEFYYNYEAKEKYILRAIAKVFKEKNMGTNVRIDEEKNTVETDYYIQDNWRTKCSAKVKRISWKECEVTLSVTTEKETAKGLEMRRLLDKEKYMKIFDRIELKVYEEMYKTE